MKNLFISLLTTIIFIISVATLKCQIINIPIDYLSIQDGMNAAQPGDTVLVDDGEYFENINYRGKNIVVASKFIIDKNASHILNTIINGSQSTEVDTGSCVIFGSGEDSTAVLQGFTLTGGTGTSYVFGGGAAIFREGGCIIMSYSSATIKNNLIIDNESVVIAGVQGGGGGGISSMYGNPRILNNVIMNNTASYAAGMVLNWSGGIIRNNIIYNNTGGGQYGTAGLMIWQSNPWTAIVENNTIVENHSTSIAGGLSIEQTSAIIRNNIIWGNTQLSGTQVTGYQSSIFEYCNTEETYSGTGNISLNPEFQSTGFLLGSQSPCIDAGNPGMNFNDVEDPGNPGFALYPSLGELRNDIGAYGGSGASLLPDFTIVGIKELSEEILPESILLYQNYPNPFNPTTSIKYTLGIKEFVSLKIYDILGNEVATLVNEEKPAGEYEIEFNGNKLSSGIYICNLITKSHLVSNKMILLK